VSTIELEGRRLRLTNLEKVLWPRAQRTKAWLIEYYTRIAPVLLPHVAGRPLTMRRFPDGVGGISWHQNECRGEPEWFHVLETPGRGGRILRFCVVEDLSSLIWVANQGTMELHPFQWRVDEPRRPVTLVFDLDPGPPAALAECARVALLLRNVLDELGLVSFAKTSGSLGLHLHVPLNVPHDGEQVKRFSRTLAEALAQAHPQEVIAEVDKSRRAGKVFLDWLQNDPTRQTVAPYSLRGLEWPTVATPVAWDEVERGDRLTFLGEDVLERVERDGDLFAEVLTLRQQLPPV
jgi:bifunctional non-homologous end joining protein LigD